MPDHIKPKERIVCQYNPKKIIQHSSSGNTYKFSFFLLEQLGMIRIV